MREFTLDQERKASINNARIMREAIKSRDIEREKARKAKREALNYEN